MKWIIPLSLASLCGTQVSAIVQHRVSSNHKITRLNEWPMIFSHDAGTGYFEPRGNVIEGVTDFFIGKAAKNQQGTFTKQLDAGARALDIRPWCVDNKIVFHHGEVVVDYPIKDAYEEVIKWNAAHPDELVILAPSNFHSVDPAVNCRAEYASMVASLNLHQARTRELWKDTQMPGVRESITVDEAQILAGGYGIPLEINGDYIVGNWRPSEGVCYGLGDLLDYIPGMNEWIPDSSQASSGTPLDFALGPLQDATDGIIEALGEKNFIYENCYKYGKYHVEMRRIWNEFVTDPSQFEERLWKVAGHWQYDTESMILMFVSMSSILDDVTRSNINDYVADRIRNHEFPHGLNMIGLDNVEHAGPEVKQAMTDTLIISDTFGGRSAQSFDDYITGVKDGEIRYVLPTASVGCACVLGFGLLVKKIAGRGSRETMIGGMTRKSFEDLQSMKMQGKEVYDPKTNTMTTADML